MWLTRNPDLKIEGYAGTGNQGWELCMATRPDVVLLDVEMPDGDGMDLAKRLHDELPKTRVLIMTGRVDPHTAWRADRAGVQGLVDKTMQSKLFGEAIRLVAEGSRYLSPSFRKIREKWLAVPEAFQKVLTNRELAVLFRVTEGQSDTVIGKDLNISAETVAGHRKSIRKKLGLHDDCSLVAYGRE
jgi:DNA-binding NarL/FixJ family response regulator